MTNADLAAETRALERSADKLDHKAQVLRAVPSSADTLEVSPRNRIKGHEQEILEWLDEALRWLRVVDENLMEHAPKALLQQETDALWNGIQRLRRALFEHVFASDSLLAHLSPETQQGAGFRSSKIEDEYRKLLTELEPYRELWRILDQDPGWKKTQTTTEVRETIRQRTRDATAIRNLFGDYRVVADALLVQLRDFVVSESEPLN
jgi:hypothetical protein